jgi:hypothetical protein
MPGGLWVPLDVNYAEDDKLVEAGVMAELLYVRGLAFVKRAQTDGYIRTGQLGSIATRIPNPKRQVDRLLDVGAWESTDTGWFVTAWLKRNPAVAEYHAAKSEAGALGAHRRWHLPPTGSPSSDCKFCMANGWHQP